jgi:hypothetical protein
MHKVPALAIALLTMGGAARADRQFNGQQLNGQQLNGQQLNGQQLNGQQLNGVQLNGQQLNGQQLNGQQLNGTLLMGSFIDAPMCAHSETVTGDPLPASCNACANMVCNGTGASPKCCTTAWDASCVSAAQSACTISAHSLVGNGTITAYMMPTVDNNTRTVNTQPVTLRIKSVERPEFERNVCTGKGPTLNCELENQPWLGPNADIWLYQVEYWAPSQCTSGNCVPPGWHPLCPNGAAAIPIAGTWESGTGHFLDRTVCDPNGQNCVYELEHNGGDMIPGSDATSFVFACQDVGALAKCIVNDQYKPWRNSTAYYADGNTLTVSRQGAFESCVRMIRADYCGDGMPHTQTGTEIDVADGIGLESRVISTYGFEAEWTPTGASCISRTRYNGADPGAPGFTVADYINQNCGNAWNRPVFVGNSCGAASDLQYGVVIIPNPHGVGGPPAIEPNAYTMNWSSTLPTN